MLGWSPHDAIRVCGESDVSGLTPIFCSPPREATVREQPGEQPAGPQQTPHLSAPGSDLPASRTARNQFLFKPPGHGLLLEQPKLGSGCLYLRDSRFHFTMNLAI